MEKKKYDLEERLITYSVFLIDIINTLNNDRVNHHLSNQLIRSSTSVSLHYGEAQSAESRKDFIHKMKVILKELRESMICLKIIKRTSASKVESDISIAIKESNELVSIFVKSIATARKNTNIK